MFFVGISAHLFIYMLVPAFLVVCFYFKGIAGPSEVAGSFPETVVYEHVMHRYSEKTYVYQLQKQQQVFQPKVENNTKFVPLSFGICFPPIFYLPPAITCTALRAPPVSLVM